MSIIPEFGVIEETQKQPEFPVRRLLIVPHQERALVVSRDAFGPNTLNNNVVEMQKSYCYPNTREVISFREATTSESISATVYDFARIAKPEILNPKWLQAGRIVRASEGVWANPPKDAEGKFITDEKTLKSFLSRAKPVKVGKGNIYIVSNGEIMGPDGKPLKDFGYAEYGTFGLDVQESKAFAEGGLARVLEHTETTAKNLRAISSKDNYRYDVNVWGYEPSTKPILRVASLDSGRVSGRLDVDGYGWLGGDGYAFGVLDRSAEGACKK